MSKKRVMRSSRVVFYLLQIYKKKFSTKFNSGFKNVVHKRKPIVLYILYVVKNKDMNDHVDGILIKCYIIYNASSWYILFEYLKMAKK